MGDWADFDFENIPGTKKGNPRMVSFLSFEKYCEDEPIGNFLYINMDHVEAVQFEAVIIKTKVYNTIIFYTNNSAHHVLDDDNYQIDKFFDIYGQGGESDYPPDDI